MTGIAPFVDGLCPLLCIGGVTSALAGEAMQ
jgi:hypothetical protein